ncbi:hypothetical protein CAPTEDRAFT_176397 [Capitella teleta]|uniref:Cilia- and flagella-associated protein 69 ARM repeats domain-containing protein n=1 Tax=Capitella teleta TaxID=283909 RepID=R7V9D8_CAPTE|nr:hypothetical protein CAPTEDRAFT_176397 [Capitella teleta]|eukprot:ELU15468.1 hypothetical protein CAPTEDRAFT_176397 [Capitella teleta]
MKDLVAVFKVLNICADRIEESSVYIDPMIEIIRLCGIPFLKEKSSDEIAFEQIAIESVAQLGYLMRVPCPGVRNEICNTLITFYCAKNAGQMRTLFFPGHKANTLDYNQRILEKSDVAETLVKSLALIEEDTEIRSSVLGVLQRLSRKSASNCDQMLQADGANRLCSRLNDSDPSGQLMFRSIDILWNILELGKREEFAKQLSNNNCINQLRDAFIHFLTQGFSHYQRQLRNDLLVIATLIATHATRAPFIETGFVKQLTLFATFQEVKSHNALVRHLKLMKNQEDFELKKLLINILVVLSKDPAVIPIFSEGKLLLALFSYVKANERVMPPQDWTVAQFEEIQLLALSALTTLCPLMEEEYMTCQGSTRLLLLLEWCFGSDEFGGHGNSFHGAGGRGNKRAQMRHCLRLIRSMVSNGKENILQDLADQGAITQLTTILSRFLQIRSKRTEDSIDIEIQTDMLIILSALCENDMHRKELFGSQGVDVVVDFLNTDPHLLSSGLGHHRLLLSAVDCVWCAIVGCYVTEDYFLEKEGVFFLIDLLQNSPKNMHNLILGCLLDIAESPKTIAHIAAWRGPLDISAAHLLCDIWREEEEEIGVQRDELGAIKDIHRPLMGGLQEQQGVIAVPANCPSQAIVDVSENMRAKLYALFCKTGFIELPGLTTEDHVTLTIIEHYMDFKLGEVWSEIQQELVQEEVRPVTPDLQALEAISRTIEERAEHVLQVQKELTEAQHQQDLIDEQEQYAEIRENHRQKEKAIKNFNEFVARTSNHLLLRAAKERQELSVDASRVQSNYKAQDNFHATDISNLNTTTFGGRCIQVESTPLALTGGLLVNYDSTTGTIKPRKYTEEEN